MGFPKGFLWGAGSAAHQVEGGNVGNDWWAWERNPESPCVEESKDACDQWNRYLTDLDLLAGLGLNAYRFSVEWSRIEPRQGQISKCALDHYRHLCEAARRRGVEPVVVFQHFTLPLWVAANGGWSDRATVTHFERFCETVAGHLAGAFGYACTINEPNVVAAFGYEVGIFPPGERSLARKESVSELLVAAHLAGAHVIRSAAPGVKVGLALAMHEYAGEPGYEEQLSQMRRSTEDVFLEATKGDDFIGVQTYTRLHIGRDGLHGPPAGTRKTQIGLEFRPEALGVTVRRAAAVTGLPVMVAESGVCTEDDSERIEYVECALRAVETCLAEGVEVLGYIYWSALDSFEWVLGYWPKYGLIEVDRQTQARTPRGSGRWLGRVARANSLDVA